MRIPISYDGAFRGLASTIGMGPSRSHVTIDDDQVVVHLGWGFHTRFPRSAVAGTRIDDRKPISRGAHGWQGRWLVNGAGSPLVAIDLDPPARAYVLGVPIRLRRLTVSVEDPDALMAALR